MGRLLFALVLAFVGWIAFQATAVSRRTHARRAAHAELARRASEDSVAEAEALRALRKATGTNGLSRVARGHATTPEWVQLLQAKRLTTPQPAPERDGAADASRIRRYAQYTYLDHVAGQNDHKLARWPARSEPLRVWVQGNPGLTGWTSQHRSVARGALRTWDEAQLPFRIVAVDDSTTADVFFLWTSSFSSVTQRIGETNRVTDEHGWIVTAVVTLAITEPGSSTKALDVYTIQNAARHEIGHVIGLDHSPDKNDIMAAYAGEQPRLSERDVNSARLLYALSPGWYAGPVVSPRDRPNPYAIRGMPPRPPTRTR